MIILCEFYKENWANTMQTFATADCLYIMASQVEHWTCDQQVVGSNSTLGQKLCSNLGQVVHTYVPLSPSSMTWYRPRGGDALQPGR